MPESRGMFRGDSGWNGRHSKRHSGGAAVPPSSTFLYHKKILSYREDDPGSLTGVTFGSA